MARTLINDTANVTFKRKSDGHVIFTAEAQLASISQQVSEEKLKGGIGNRTIALLRSDKEVTLQVRNALFDFEWLSMTQGVAVEKGKEATVWKREDSLPVVDNGGTLEVTIKGKPLNDEIKLVNPKGESIDADVLEKVAEVPTSFAKKGEKISVSYQEKIVGNVLTMDAQKFSEAYEVEYATIEYDPDTYQVVADLYIQFDHVIPSGSFDMSLENGSALAPELSFEAMTSGTSTEIGRFIEQERSADTP
ncbi:hypothetical protein FZC83_02385 [Rossellomorea marisflavi]|uniref:Uncharacterized protein n=1 Tax=Rossellomorea marisflavi TaxID=189381 RepID=A0A5D4S3J8_9BACI|nr:hypothetical protein [Rossellomorea marisflavi]TYS56442.1 hypothetical protein FZC83_02385 [Rossellomorea marisflavi]